MGNSEKLTSSNALNLGGMASKSIKSFKSDEISILVDPVLEPYLFDFLTGFLLERYQFEQHKTKKEKKEIVRLNIVSKLSSWRRRSKYSKMMTLIDSINFVKQLVNNPPNFTNAESFVKEAKSIASKNGYGCAVYGAKELTKMKWGGLLAVGKGSANEPKCIILQHFGGQKKDPPIVLIGKGVIFDAGGYNLKPSKSIEEMHQDMAGAATVLGLFKSLKALEVKKNIVGIMPLAENLISGNAYKPSEIITSLSGKTIEITNTDAEGRLILADAITYGLKFNPRYVITIATLTGAVITALGNRYAGLFSNNEELKQQLLKSGEKTDDLLWELPIHEDYREKMKSPIADLRNIDSGTNIFAGSSKASAFLEYFMGKTPWAHIDLGGTAFTNDPKPYQTPGATAHGLGVLMDYLQNLD